MDEALRRRIDGCGNRSRIEGVVTALAIAHKGCHLGADVVVQPAVALVDVLCAQRERGVVVARAGGLRAQRAGGQIAKHQQRQRADLRARALQRGDGNHAGRVHRARVGVGDGNRVTLGVNKLAGGLRCGGQRSLLSRAQTAAEAFVVAKIENLVFADRAARRRAKLVLHQRRGLPVGGRDWAFRVEDRVAQVLPQVAVQLIGATARNLVHQPACCLAKLGVLVAGGKAELAQRVRAQLDRLVREAKVVQAPAIVIQAVQQEGVHLAAQAVYVVSALAAGGAFNLQRGLVHARHQQRQVGRVASIQRQVYHLCRVDDHAAVARIGLQQCRAGRHRHLLGHVGRNQRQIHALVRAHKHGEGHRRRVLIATALRRDRVVARRNIVEHVVAGLVAGGCAGGTGVRALERHRYSGRCPAAGIVHRANHDAAIKLRPGYDRYRQKRKEA